MRDARTFRQEEVTHSFNQAAHTYDSSAVLQQETAQRLIERLATIHFTPQTILDLGAGTGYCSSLLKTHFPQAQIISLDIAQQMLQVAKQQADTCVCADANALPLADAAIDLIISNMLLHWLPLDKALYQEFHRVLSPKGLLLFSTLGPDTLCELRDSWQSVEPDVAHVHDFIDMHHIGDVLMQTQFSDPVMEREPLTIDYAAVRELLIDLQRLGANNKHPQRRRTLSGKFKLQQMIAQYEQLRSTDGLLPATYEVIYGLAWRGNIPEQSLSSGAPVAIPLSAIKKPR